MWETHHKRPQNFCFRLEKVFLAWRRAGGAAGEVRTAEACVGPRGKPGPVSQVIIAVRKLAPGNEGSGTPEKKCCVLHRGGSAHKQPGQDSKSPVRPRSHRIIPRPSNMA